MSPTRKFLLIILLAFTCSQAIAQKQVDYSNPIEYTIGGITVSGANILDKNALTSMSGLAVGQKVKIPGDDITNALKKLWKQGILGDVQINITNIEGAKVFLEIALTERPRLSRFFFPDSPKGQTQTLSDKVNLVRGQVVTDVMIKNAKLALSRHYSDKGFRNAEIKIVPRKDSIMTNSVMLNIYIDKKNKVRIKELNIEGITAFKEQKVRRKLKKTKEKRFGRIFSPSKMIDEKYLEDKESLIAFYNKNGYRDAKIEEDSITKNEDGTVNIHMKLNEGRQFFYRKISWVGNYVYPDSVLAQILGIERGDIYDAEELNKRLNFNPTGNDVTSIYMDNGYLFFNINPIEVMVEEDSIDIEMRIYEGEQAEIRNIIVNGNTKTSDHVIYREIRTIPGRKFSRSDLIRTQRELAQLGYFDPEQIGINPQPNLNDGTVDIVYDLVERPSDQIELSGGWGGAFGFVGTLGVVFNNFSLRKAGDLKSWRPLPAGDGQRLSIRMQANGRRFQTYSLSFTEPWLGGKQPNSFTVNFTRTISRIIDGFSNTVSGSLKLSGATVSLGRRLQFPDDFFTMINSVGFNQYQLDNFTLRGFGNFNNGTSYSITFNTTIARNSINNPTFPRSGSNVSLSINLTPPYSKISNNSEFTSVENRFKWVEYHKWMFDNSWFVSIAGNLVLNARAHMGFLGTYNQEKGISPFERFILGGDGLAQANFGVGQDIIGLRGYTNNSIVPFTFDPVTENFDNDAGGTIYNKFVLEMRYPISLNPSATIFVLGFVEGGNNWGTFREFNPFQINRSAGIGARIFMPAFGLLGVDWAYGFDEVVGAPDANGPQFHFTIGQQIR
ncbi:MAG: outer membrane protein assembly factor BamA [Flammeovirgaceae bacterium]